MVRVISTSLPSPSFVETHDPAMQRVRAFCDKAARSALPVLIEGEPGAGKGSLARQIHALGDRAARPFVTVNCADVAWDRLAPALFGTHRTGGSSQAGKFHKAQGGTLLLREVGELPEEVQARLARVLESGEIQPLGALRPERVSVRVIASSTSRLLNLARSGGIREDLFYRLNVLPVYMPPLRERPADVLALASAFTLRFAAETGHHRTGLSAAAGDLLRAYNWPGNVRELESVIYRAVALADAPELAPADFPSVLARTAGREAAADLTRSLGAASAPVHVDDAIPRRKQMEGSGVPDRFLTTDGEVTPLAELERELIMFALKKHGGHMSQIARALGIGRSTLYRKLKDYGLEGSMAAATA